MTEIIISIVLIVIVLFLFYMEVKNKDRKQLGDLVGYLQALDDLLVHAGVIEDDNESIIASHDGSRVRYDKDFPRTEVWMERKIKNDD